MNLSYVPVNIFIATRTEVVNRMKRAKVSVKLPSTAGI